MRRLTFPEGGGCWHRGITAICRFSGVLAPPYGPMTSWCWWATWWKGRTASPPSGSSWSWRAEHGVRPEGNCDNLVSEFVAAQEGGSTALCGRVAGPLSAGADGPRRRFETRGPEAAALREQCGPLRPELASLEAMPEILLTPTTSSSTAAADEAHLEGWTPGSA